LISWQGKLPVWSEFFRDGVMTKLTIPIQILIATLGAVFLFPKVALAQVQNSEKTVVIDFDNLADFEIVDDQFLELGVDFNGNARVLTQGISLAPAFPPFSSRNVIFDDTVLSSGELRIDAVDSLWSRVGGYITGNSRITMTAFATDNSILGTTATDGPNFAGSGFGFPPNIFLDITASGISHVTFSDSGNTFTVDNFTFTQQPAQTQPPTSVPEPASMLGLFAAGILGTGAILRRKRE
jgi:hypothetical protein